MIYEGGVLKRILVDGGYIEGGAYYFYLTDHLGNNRVVANASGGIVQTNHYYPFGMSFAEGITASGQPYKYNGKELDTERGLNLYDYSARLMDPALGRFSTMDPLAEDYYDVSPYTYCRNNPMRFVDPDGREIQIPPTVIPLPFMPLPPYKPVSATIPNPPPVRVVISDIKNYFSDAYENLKATLLTTSIMILPLLESTNNEEGEQSNTLESSSKDTNSSEKKVNPKREAREKAREKKNNQPASEKYAKDKAKAKEKAEGPDARRRAHDAKDKGAPDRSKKQIDEDYEIK